MHISQQDSHHSPVFRGSPTAFRLTANTPIPRHAPSASLLSTSAIACSSGIASRTATHYLPAVPCHS